MSKTNWESYLEELYRRIGRPEVLRVLFFVPLLNGEWEVVAAFSSRSDVDRTLKGLRITPPWGVDWAQLEEGLLIEGIPGGSLRSFSCFPEAGPQERVFYFHIALSPVLMLVFILSRDITERLREVLKEYSIPFKEAHKLWIARNRHLILDRFLSNLALLLRSTEAYTYHHSLRVASLAEGIARRLGLSLERQETVRIAGLIHDLGKLFIPREILSKKGKLTEEEFAKVKDHVLELDRIFFGNEFVEQYVSLARYHHERLDGSGYLGLRGEEIPLESRILAVCDVFDALIHDRPYREAYSLEGTIRELARLGEEGKLDRDVIRALLVEIPEFYLAPQEGKRIPLFPGLDVSLRRATERKEEVYRGHVGESEEEKTIVTFPTEVPLEPGEEVLISYELSYLTVEIKARYLSRNGERYFFLTEGATRRQRGFVLPWNLEIRFLKMRIGELEDLIRETMRNLSRFVKARAEAIGGECLAFLTDDLSLKRGDTVVILFEAYGEHFLIPGRVTKIEDFGFAQRVLVEDFVLSEQTVDRLYRVLSRRRAELEPVSFQSTP